MTEKYEVVNVLGSGYSVADLRRDFFEWIYEGNSIQKESIMGRILQNINDCLDPVLKQELRKALGDELDGLGELDGWERDYNRSMTPLETDFVQKGLLSMSEANSLGKVVVDVGAGSNSVTTLLPFDKHKVVEIDLVGPDQINEGRLYLRLDVRRIDECNSATRYALARVLSFLDLDGDGPEALQDRVDAMVFSFILNYVNYKALLTEMSFYLKPGGKFIIVNKPWWGVINLLNKNPHKPCDNIKMIEFLEDLGFEIDIDQIRFVQNEYDSIINSTTNLQDDCIFLVAKKV